MYPVPPELNQALRFSISDTTGVAPEQMSDMHRWMVANPSSWMLERPEVIGDDRRSGDGAYLLTGEAGCGKTTLMAQEANHFKKSTRNYVAHINFMDAFRIDPDTRNDDVMPRLGDFLKAQLEWAVADYGRHFGHNMLRTDYRAARVREIVLRESDGFLGKAKDRFMHLITDMSADDILSEPVLCAAAERWENEKQELDLSLRAIQGARSDLRVILLFDNLDNLGGPHAARCLAGILRTRKVGTLMFCAIRSENEYYAANLNTYLSDRIEVDVPNLSQVISIRTKGLASFYRETRQKTPRGIVAAGTSTARVMSKLLNDRNGYRILTSWHNSNVRQMLSYVAASRARLEASRTETELHGAILGSLIWHMDAKEDFLLTMLNPADNAASGLPFLFLKLRILAYIRKHERQCELKTLRGVFAKYGVAKDAIEQALNRLHSPTQAAGAFIRLFRDESGKAQVLLLPAGDFFFSELAYSVEFLSYQEEKKGSNQVFSSAGRLLAASNFVNNRLLPAFRKEHPYVLDHVKPTVAHQRRLRSYRRDFGYGENQWFVSGLRESLQGYAVGNSLTAVEPVRSALETDAVKAYLRSMREIQAMENQLNLVLSLDLETGA